MPSNNPLLNDIFNSNQAKIEAWFAEEWQKTPPPFYSSVDLRDAGFKLAPVDTNLFPAGFNNLSKDDFARAIAATKDAIKCICPEVKRLLLIPESHSRNLFYFESLAVLFDILTQAGFDTRIGSLDEKLTQAFEPELASGRKIKIEPLLRKNNQVGVPDFFPCCIVLNNDLSEGIPKLLENLDQQRIMPSAQLGWFYRLKSQHFRFYELVAEEFAKEFGFDAWLINPYFDHCPEVDFMKQGGQDCLIRNAKTIMKKIQLSYDQYKLNEKPFLAIKADAGTYGMAVMMVDDPEQLGSLNRKERTRMSTSKGGKQVTKAFIQEGVPTRETTTSGKTAETVVYLMGRQVIGGFYRVHENRGNNENLNAPGMHFEPMQPNYLHSVVARLAALAAARELANIL